MTKNSGFVCFTDLVRNSCIPFLPPISQWKVNNFSGNCETNSGQDPELVIYVSVLCVVLVIFLLLGFVSVLGVLFVVFSLLFPDVSC